MSGRVNQKCKRTDHPATFLWRRDNEFCSQNYSVAWWQKSNCKLEVPWIPGIEFCNKSLKLSLLFDFFIRRVTASPLKNGCFWFFVFLTIPPLKISLVLWHPQVGTACWLCTRQHHGLGQLSVLPGIQCSPCFTPPRSWRAWPALLVAFLTSFTLLFWLYNVRTIERETFVSSVYN